MYIGLMHIHSLLRWVLLLLLIVSIVKAFNGKKKGLLFDESDKKRTLFTMITAHIQLLIGLVLYVISPIVMTARMDMKIAMKDSVLRFWAIEHISMIILAIAFITIGHIRAKKLTSDLEKYKAIATFFTIALVLILISIPWPFRLVGAGRGWF